MNYTINPCCGCQKNYNPADINNINNCVYETAGAFYNANSVEQLSDSPFVSNICDCINTAKRLSNKKREFRINPPPLFKQIPNYYPPLLKKYNNKEQAYQECYNLCQYTSYPEDCRKKCKIQNDSVIGIR